MTIALGVLVPNGVVIAADTQETYGLGFAKYDTRKIMSARKRDGQRSLAASGGGDSDYIDSLHQDYIDAFKQTPTPDGLQTQLQQRLTAFYQDHMLPFTPKERPDIGSLVGMTWRDGKSQLLASRLNRLGRKKHFATDGVGRVHASYLLSRLLPAKDTMTVWQAASLAAFTIFHVKEYVDGCGRGTHITVLREGGAWYVSEQAMQSLEQRFADYLRRDVQRVHGMLGAANVVAPEDELMQITEGDLIQTQGEAVFD